MDLLQTVRKEGSRGGVDFKWTDVATSAHRENYLGHSLMAPVGRWQKGRDLNWYAKADDAHMTAEEKAAEEQARKKEELRLVKEAEEDAMAKALGLPVPDRSGANAVPVGVSQREVNKALREALADDEEEPQEKGIDEAAGGTGIMEGEIAMRPTVETDEESGCARGRGMLIKNGDIGTDTGLDPDLRSTENTDLGVQSAEEKTTGIASIERTARSDQGVVKESADDHATGPEADHRMNDQKGGLTDMRIDARFST